jgi:hypothetical protein
VSKTIGALVALGLALTVGCSDDKGGDASGSEFCEGLESFIASEDPDAVDTFAELEPPAEIADDVDALVGYLQALAAGETPDDATSEEYFAAGERVNTYAVDECGLDTES